MQIELNKIYLGDCIEVMKTWPDNFVDTIITDPPYGLEFMGKSWDKGVPGIPFWAEMLRICKPGAMILAFGGTRTFHRMAVAIEDAGWEIRDCLTWLYGSGFPKSLDISKAIDKASRFFYVAKADRAERNEGCDELPKKTSGMVSNTSGQHITRRDGGAPDPSGNFHPTVKPLDLMKYLVNLTKTPKGGIVLDPFAGSGTTLWAAESHNRPWIGIEMNAEYIKIAEARISMERAQLKMF